MVSWLYGLRALGTAPFWAWGFRVFAYFQVQGCRASGILRIRTGALAASVEADLQTVLISIASLG